MSSTMSANSGGHWVVLPDPSSMISSSSLTAFTWPIMVTWFPSIYIRLLQKPQSLNFTSPSISVVMCGRGRSCHSAMFNWFGTWDIALESNELFQIKHVNCIGKWTFQELCVYWCSYFNGRTRLYIFSSASSFLFFVFVLIWVLLFSVPSYSRILSAIWSGTWQVGQVASVREAMLTAQA